MQLVIDLGGTEPWNHTILSILEVFASEVLWSCLHSILNAMVGTNVVVVTYTGKLYRMMVAEHPNRCGPVNAAVVADVRNPPSCVRRNRRWKWESEYSYKSEFP